jgi:hypothetical protein
MAITMTLTKDMFISSMRDIRPDNFSYEGLGELFEFFDSLDPEQIAYDPIGICCDFSQCSLREFCDAYGLECDDNDLIDTVIGHIGQNGFWYTLLNDDKEVLFENF